MQCGKTAYPLEAVTGQDINYHKLCFKCTVCTQTLNVKSFKKYEGKIYCNTHCPKPASGPIGADSIGMKNALNAPKKTVHTGIQKNDPKVAPATSTDFTQNELKDQSTENAPSDSAVTYEEHPAEQSTTNETEEYVESNQ